MPRCRAASRPGESAYGPGSSRGFPFAHLLGIYAASEVEDYGEGDSVLSEGDEVHGLFCVLAGSFELSSGGQATRRLDRGDHFGGPALLLPGTSVVTLRAREPGRLLRLDGERFRTLASARPRVALTLLSRLALGAFEKLGEAGDGLGLRPLERRLAWWNPLAWARK